jgi:hypothetical protein
MVLLLRFKREAFYLAKHRDVLASFDKFSRLEQSYIIEPIEVSKKGGYLSLDFVADRHEANSQGR